MSNHRTIFAYGLNERELDFLLHLAPSRSEVKDVGDAYMDMIAIYSCAIVINPEGGLKEAIDEVLSFCVQGGFSGEKVIFTKDLIVPPVIKDKVHIIDFVPKNSEKIKFLLLSAQRARVKDYDFSRKLSQSIKILRLIKNSNGITTKELSAKTEMHPRNVQRYINALRVSGEFIDHDKKKGWYLMEGISPLLDIW